MKFQTNHQSKGLEEFCIKLIEKHLERKNMSIFYTKNKVELKKQNRMRKRREEEKT